MNSKIIALDALASITTSLKSEGKKIAHCHGCFDLMHLGHIKHFEAAKNTADVLIVTLTPDRFVNKGPGRPVFNEMHRMEAIAALQCVDYVALNKWETAVETIKIVKPDFYVKGQDYKNAKDDITGNIGFEEEAVKAVGGKFYITEEVQFSSSKLINTHFSPLSDSVQSFLADFKSRHSAESVIAEIEKLKDAKILVIGDTIIDEYHYCKPLGKSSKSPTISSVYLRGESYAGGVLAIANHLAQFAGKVEMMTCLGEENTQQELIEQKLSPSVDRKFFYRKNAPTPTKRRYLDKYLNIKLFEVTFMNDSYIEKELEEQMITYLKSVLANYDMVMIADFGHGLISPAIIKFLEESGKYLAVNAQTNSNNYGFNYITKYSRANYISIDEKELRLPFGDNYGAVEPLIEKLKAISHAELIQITLGQEGSVIYYDKTFAKAPALASAVKDSVGAGDAVLSVTALCAQMGVAPEIIIFVGNCVGSLAVEIIGNEHPVYKKDLTKFIKHLLK
ncbi:MAG: adenylyltransferase/cytidyltransferase family protein [Bacteroidetes bacterium]|nr:adenylyltransferase/cytidyltransferase family protein [Bacteroidota bacterium]